MGNRPLVTLVGAAGIVPDQTLERRIAATLQVKGGRRSPPSDCRAIVPYVTISGKSRPPAQDGNALRRRHKITNRQDGTKCVTGYLQTILTDNRVHCYTLCKCNNTLQMGGRPALCISTDRCIIPPLSDLPISATQISCLRPPFLIPRAGVNVEGWRVAFKSLLPTLLLISRFRIPMFSTARAAHWRRIIAHQEIPALSAPAAVAVGNTAVGDVKQQFAGWNPYSATD